VVKRENVHESFDIDVFSWKEFFDNLVNVIADIVKCLVERSGNIRVLRNCGRKVRKALRKVCSPCTLFLNRVRMFVLWCALSLCNLLKKREQVEREWCTFSE
jgi:hypothetical protein